MEIVSKLVNIEAEFPIDNMFIEKKLCKMGIEPLRWAIVGVSRCETVLDCDEQSKQVEHNDSSCGLQAKSKPTGANQNSFDLTISLACKNL